MARRMSEYLEIDEDSSGKETIQCAKCKYVFCPLTQNYKNYAIFGEYPLDRAGPAVFYPPSQRFILREFYCPECGTMLDVEMVLKDEPPLWNIQLKPKS